MTAERNIKRPMRKNRRMLDRNEVAAAFKDDDRFPPILSLCQAAQLAHFSPATVKRFVSEGYFLTRSAMNVRNVRSQTYVGIDIYKHRVGPLIQTAYLWIVASDMKSWHDMHKELDR